MGTWNTNYENTPRNKNNPGYGAPSIRELKTEISQRLELEHFSGPTWENTSTYTSDTGYHREGSARVRVTDAYSGNADRAASLITDLRVGRIEMDLRDLPLVAGDGTKIDLPERTYDGQTESQNPAKFDTTNTSVDDKAQIIKVQAYDDASGTLVSKEIFNAGRFVDVKFDQLIDGLKEFELAPKLPDPGIDIGQSTFGGDWFRSELDGISDDTMRVGTNMFNVREQLIRMLTENPYDITTLLAEFLNTRDSTYIDESTGKVGRTLNVNSINAESVTGVVWV